MAPVTSVTKDIFRRYFVAALTSIGIPIDQANLFCCQNQTKKLKDLGICVTISMHIDEFMEARVPDYKGCMPNDDWETIVNYNFTYD